MILILTESPGTARRLAAFFAAGGSCIHSEGEPPVCMATLGYVLVPPNTLNPLALHSNGDTLQEERQVRHSDVLRRILDAASRATQIILATDPDEEGEVIAQDLAMILTEFGCGELSAARMHLYGLDDTSINDACKAAESVHLATMSYDWPLALPGHTRRMMDRWIAGSLGSPEQPVGRVIAGFLEAAQRPERYAAPKLQEGIPAHLGDLLLADELMDTPVQGITGALQGLYEVGRVSYPRTDSHDLVARHQHSHTALHLLGTTSQKAEIRDMAYMEPPRMPLEARLLCAVARREMAAEGENVFPPKAAQSADPARHAQNLRERTVLRVLLAQNLGRPSTWTAFATRHAGWMTDDGRFLSPQGRRMAAHQPQALGLSFQHDFRAFLERLPNFGSTSPGRQAGHYAMDALKLLDGASVQCMRERLDQESATHDWREAIARPSVTQGVDF